MSLLSKTEIQEGIVALGDDHSQRQQEQQADGKGLCPADVGAVPVQNRQFLPRIACQRRGNKEQQVVLELIYCGGVGQGGIAETEHDTKVVKAVTQIFVIEQDPADEYQQQS